MSLLPHISGRQVVAVMEKIGYEFDHEKGSHIVLRQADAPHRRLTVPDHPEIPKGTLRAIIREAGLSVDVFTSLL